ncbi:MAG: DMT family transporter [Phycisphaerae bacterium]
MSVISGHHGSQHTRGVLLLVAAAALWSLNGLLIKALQSAGAGGCSIACGRSLFAAAFLAPWALRRWRPIADKPWVAATVLAFTAMTLSFVLATTLTTAANAIILQYTAPAWVFLLSPLILAEPAGRRHWVALCGAMAGVGIIFVFEFATEAVGLVVGLGSGLVFGTQTVLMRRVRAVNPVVLAFMVCAGSGMALLPVAGLVEAVLPTKEQLYLLALMGARRRPLRCR